MPYQYVRVTQIACQCGEPGIAESRYRMKNGKEHFFLNGHAHRSMDVCPDGKSPYQFDGESESQDIKQCSNQRAECVRAYHIPQGKLVV